MDAVSLAAHLEQKRADICVIGLLDTLEYLKRGGRISKTVAFAGGLLSIKPVVTIQDGEIALIGKARGSRQGNNLLVEKIHACGGIDFQLPILLGYTGLSDAFLRKYVDDSRALWEHGTDSLDEALISGVIGTHAGPRRRGGRVFPQGVRVFSGGGIGGGIGLSVPPIGYFLSPVKESDPPETAPNTS